MWHRPIATDATTDMDMRIERMIDVLADGGGLEGAAQTIRKELEPNDLKALAEEAIAARIRRLIPYQRRPTQIARAKEEGRAPARAVDQNGRLREGTKANSQAPVSYFGDMQWASGIARAALKTRTIGSDDCNRCSGAVR
jgi:hypothetical protein